MHLGLKKKEKKWRRKLECRELFRFAKTALKCNFLPVHLWYSVTQSYANIFWGDVVLDTFNNVSRDEILYQIYIKQICPDFLWALFCRELYFFKYAFSSSITLQILNPHNKDPKRFAFHIFGLKRCLHHCIPC